MKIEHRYILISILYLVGLPIAGCGLGVVFAWVLGLVSGGTSALGYEISVFMWGCIGLYAGICGFIPLRRMHLVNKAYAPKK